MAQLDLATSPENTESTCTPTTSPSDRRPHFPSSSFIRLLDSNKPAPVLIPSLIVSKPPVSEQSSENQEEDGRPFGQFLPNLRIVTPLPHFLEGNQNVLEVYSVQEIQDLDPLKAERRKFFHPTKGSFQCIFPRVKASLKLYRGQCKFCHAQPAYLVFGHQTVGERQSATATIYTEDGLELTIDHIVPTSKGGPDIETNWQVLCLSCNQLKGEDVSKQHQLWHKKLFDSLTVLAKDDQELLNGLDILKNSTILSPGFMPVPIEHFESVQEAIKSLQHQAAIRFFLVAQFQQIHHQLQKRNSSYEEKLYKILSNAYFQALAVREDVKVGELQNENPSSSSSS